MEVAHHPRRRAAQRNLKAALAAQSVFRHKTRKLSLRPTFRAIVCLHVGVVAVFRVAAHRNRIDIAYSDAGFPSRRTSSCSRKIVQEARHERAFFSTIRQFRRGRRVVVDIAVA
jgi:hypothetical protein